MSEVYGVIIAYKNLARAHQALESAMANRGILAPVGIELRIHDNTEKNENIHRIWNRSLKTAEELGCPYFLILNPDTMCEPNWLPRMLSIMHRNSQVVAVSPSTNHCYNEQSNRDPVLMELAKDSWVPNVLVPGFCTIFRTDAVMRVGGWREDFQFYGGDLDLVYRLQLAGYLSAWAVGAFVYHEWGGSAKELGDLRYQELRYTGNIQLQRAMQSYQEKQGLWIAKPGGGVTYEPFAFTEEGKEDAQGEPGPGEAAHEEAAGVLRARCLREEAEEKEGLTRG